MDRHYKKGCRQAPSLSRGSRFAVCSGGRNGDRRIAPASIADRRRGHTETRAQALTERSYGYCVYRDNNDRVSRMSVTIGVSKASGSPKFENYLRWLGSEEVTTIDLMVAEDLTGAMQTVDALVLT